MRRVIFHGDGFQLPLLESAVLPPAFRHGFTTRAGGVSAAPFDSLNLGGRWGDDAAHVAENRRRLRAASGGHAIHFAAQVHGRDAAWVPADAPPTVSASPAAASSDSDGRIAVGDPGADAGADARTTAPATTPDRSTRRTAAVSADAVITARPDTAVGVYVADCVPILVADARTGVCAAVHAGWRGTVAGVLPATLGRMVDARGARPADVRVAIGPSIGPCCFEVGPEVIAAVEAAAPGARAAGAIIERTPRPHVDLWLLNRLAAEAVGVPSASIDVAGLCTVCSREGFFSYRRDRARTGQMAAFVYRTGAPEGGDQ